MSHNVRHAMVCQLSRDSRGRRWRGRPFNSVASKIICVAWYSRTHFYRKPPCVPRHVPTPRHVPACPCAWHIATAPRPARGSRRGRLPRPTARERGTGSARLGRNSNTRACDASKARRAVKIGWGLRHRILIAKFFVDRRDRPVASRARPGPPGARARRPSDKGEGEASNAPGPVPAGPWRRARPAGQGRVARWRKTAAGRCRKFPTILKEKS
jgi:hypothetical protein